mgnify:CR=1 FL=1|nr:cobalamin biosynthesis protein [uncultured Acetobacter sp.]
MSVVGLGWCKAASAPETAAFVRQMLHRSEATPLACLAVPHFRQGEELPEKVAALLGVPLIWVTEDALQAAQASCQTFSEKSLQETGFAAVAEGCALAVVGPGARLLMPKQVHEGITCAVAEGEGTR